MTVPTKTTTGDCLCRVTGPSYEQTRFSAACPYHGKDGTMVAVIKLPKKKR
jgi:hypothetical protein